MEDRTFRRLAALEDLAEMGQDLARLVRRQAYERAEAESLDAALAHDGRSEDEPTCQARTADGRNDFSRADFSRAGARAGGGDLGLVFARIARAVRQTWALHDRLDRERQARADQGAAEQAAVLKADLDDQARERATAQLRGKVRMTVVLEAVEQAIEAQGEARGEGGGYDNEAMRLYDALHERLDDPRDADDFIDLPISELVARICQDLGVIPDWNLWEYEDWAVEEAEAQTPGSPYAAPRSEALDAERTWPRASDRGTDPPP